MPVRIQSTFFPKGYAEHTPGTDDHFNSISEHHRSELRKFSDPQIEAPEVDDRQMRKLILSAKNLIRVA